MLVRVALEEVPRLKVDGNPLPDLGQVGVVELGSINNALGLLSYRVVNDDERIGCMNSPL